jgi:predicted ATPase/class 3 adenylate cyclase
VQPALPTGTVTFLFTDVEGSTRLLQRLGAEAYADALAEHRRVLREAFVRHNGVEVDTQGDAFFVAFSTAPEALAAAYEAQQNLATGPIRVRMGIHTGAPRVTEGGYVGSDVHRAARIAGVGHGGQILLSASSASLVDSGDLRDLGEHRLKDLAAPERIYQLGEGDFPLLTSLRQTNLPIPATPFLGRERELDEVMGLLTSGEVRLLTLTGPAGAGKTRLALQAAAEASDRYPDGLFWVPLAALRDAKLVLEEAARTVKARNGLAERIADRKLLLLLDNFEHVIDAAGDLGQLLAACPNLQLVVTSRELLRLPGEQAYPVPPLEPEDAAELFTARAQAAEPRFEPGPATRDMCSRLDNLPLALELAAARVPLLSPQQLLDRLSRRLDLLKGGRGVDPRQQTLRATIEWSYELLDEDERLLFDRLSVFRGGCTLEAAEVVCGADIDTLQSLLEKSLVRRQDERFWMLETIRVYAGERLEERGEAAAVAGRHADHLLARAEEVAKGAPDEPVAEAGTLHPELANIRAALEWLVASGDAEREARLATGAFWDLWTRSGLREMKAWLVSALQRSSLEPGLRADLLGAAALAAANLGESEEARAYARESLALARQRDDKRQIEWALRVLSFDEPDFGERRRLLQECEQLLRELGNETGLAWVIFLRGMTFFDEGSFDQARETFERAAAVFQGLGRRWEATNAEIAAGYALAAADRPGAVRAIVEDALATGVEFDSPAIIVEALLLAAAVRVERDPATAARLLARTRVIADETETGLERRYADLFETTETSARKQLGGRFETEWEAGRALSLDEAVALAREDE